jgi:hypothetical protein
MEAIVLVDFKDKPTGVKYKVGDNYTANKDRIDFLAGLNFVAIEFKEVDAIEIPKVKVKKPKK